MYLKIKLKFLYFLILSFVFTSSLSFAQKINLPKAEVQDDFSNSEIETFVKINEQIIPVQEKVQQEMVKTIQDNGMDVTRFQDLAQAQSTGTLREVTEDLDEIEKFNVIGQKVMKLQQEMQVEVKGIIEKSEMQTDKFEAIYMAYNTNPKVKAKVDELLKKDQ